MARTVSLEVATPEGLALDTRAEIVTAPSVVGEFGVLPDHLPMLAATRAGVLKYTVEGKLQRAAIGPGFVEAGPQKVLLLTNAFVQPADVDRESAERDLAEAELGLKNLGGSLEGHEAHELVRSVEWAQALLAASSEG